MTEDDRVREKDGISSPLGDEKPGRGGREGEEDDREEQEAVTDKDTNPSLIFLFLHRYS